MSGRYWLGNDDADRAAIRRLRVAPIASTLREKPGESAGIGNRDEYQTTDGTAEMGVVVDAACVLQGCPIGVAHVADGEQERGDWNWNRDDHQCRNCTDRSTTQLRPWVSPVW